MNMIIMWSSHDVTHLHKADIHLLGSVASREVPPYVHVVVPDDASDDVRSRHALGPLCGNKHSPIFERLVYIIHFLTTIGEVVMGNKVYLKSVNICC